MSLTLSWDLFVIVFFAIVITYSFIIGKHESVKIIISTYIAIVAAQAVGNLMQRLSGESQPFLSTVGITVDITLLATTKLLLFVATIVLLAVRGGFEVEYKTEGGGVGDTALTGLFGFVTAGLLMSTLMTFVADVPLLDKNIALTPNIALITAQSDLMKNMITYQDVWFALPAIILLIIGFTHGEEVVE
ncbi:MAG: hypothetical protein O2904_01240 [bacterium]|nr:hypothetical protein [bacterium]